MAHLAQHDEAMMQRIASNNPAMTISAASQLASRSEASRLRRSSTYNSVAKRITSRADPSGEGMTTFESDETGSPPADEESLHKSKYEVGWRRVVRNFSPSWFSVTMGTGICSLLLITIPWKADWLYWLSVAFFVLNSILFGLALIISILRYALYPQIWTVMVSLLYCRKAVPIMTFLLLSSHQQ